MRLAHLVSTLILTSYANDLDAFIPEVWAQESLMILEANMVAGNLVHRDFENQIAQFGDVVNTRQPSTFVATRKDLGDTVTVQDAIATNVPVKLNQHLHSSFLIRDGEESKGFKNLVTEYLYPAVLSIAQAVDEIVSMQAYQFLDNSAGKIGTALTKDTVVDLRGVMNINKVPVGSGQRNLILTAQQEVDLLKVPDFVNAEKVGDDGSALREGSLGRKFGFDIFTCQNSPSIATGNTLVTGAINNAGGFAKGTTVLVVNGFSAAIISGAICTVDGVPYKIASTTGGATPTGITLTTGLIRAVANAAVVVVYTPGAINNAGGYPIDWAKNLTVNGFTVSPKTGQMISINSELFGALTSPTTTSILLDRPNQSAISNSDVVGLGPAGNFGLAFHRNAIALVTRPLATPRAGTGALSYVAQFKGLSIRVTITYDGNKQGHLVTVDLLAGVKVLNKALGSALLS